MIHTVRDNLPDLLTLEQLSDDPNIYYAKYNGRYVEVSTEIPSEVHH